MSTSGGLRDQVRNAVIWRSGAQVLSQLVAWVSTFLVIRILSPADYGLYAMTAVVLVLLTLFNGMSFANAAVQQRDGGAHQLRQLFGILLLFNGALAAIQVAIAPLVAEYYRQPIITDLLRFQALILLTNPFYALGFTVLVRAMDFRRQAQVNIVAALIGAATALGGALAGWGVWTLVAAPLASFGVRGFGTLIAARAFIWPSFDFRGAGALANYGGVLMVGQLLWFVQTQADILIAGRSFSPSELGFYTTALFLAQIFVAKVVPPLNEVAFSAYAQIQDDSAAVAAGFLKSVRVVMLLAMPFCLGLAAVAQPAVQVLLGDKWLPSAPIVQLLALSMPFMTLHVMLAPAITARGNLKVSTRTALFGAVLMPVCYYLGAPYGGPGIAAAWLAGWPLLTVFSVASSLPVLAVGGKQLGEALLPPVLAGLGMLAIVTLVDHALPALPDWARLAALVAAGSAVYGGWILVFARQRLDEILGLILKR